MQQVWISRAGMPETLELRQAPDPVAGPGQLRVRVAYAGVNFADIQARMGQYPDAPPIPCVVGYEISGTVDQVGDGVAGFSPGDRVAAFTRFGGYSDTVVVPPGWAFRLPQTISLEAAAATPVNYATAWMMLVRLGNLKAGDTVLVHSAGGGVGLAALQICRWRGATAIGTASRGKHERLLDAGYAHCIDYRHRDFEAEVMRLTGGRGVDIALDPQGGRSARKSFRCLAPLGRLFLFGAAELSPGKTRSLLAMARGMLQMPWFHPLGLINRNRGVLGLNMGHLFEEFDRLSGEFQAIMQLVEEGVFTPVVDRVFPARDAASAHHYLQDRRNVGKVLLDMQEA